MSPSRTHERGAALLVVMVAVAVLTILAVQLAYDTRVSLQIAANARDDLRATYLAKSGVNLSRLVLSFQQRIDALSPQTQGVPGAPRIQLWNLVPVGSTLANGLFGRGESAAPSKASASAASEGEEGGGAPARAPSGDGFETKIEDEGRKVSAQLDAQGIGSDWQAQALYQLVCDPRWDALFDREDENGLRVSRQDLLVNLHDWIDEKEQKAELVASFPPGSCAMITTNPFEEGFQDENQPYDRGPDRYRAKNARMDSLDELYMVAGVGDAFMAAFRDDLTVYLRPGALRNVNETDKGKLVGLAAFIADPSALPALLDPKFGELLQKEVALRTYGGMIAMTPDTFQKIVASLGVAVNQTRLNALTDRSSVFGIQARGRVGAVSKTLDVVVRLDDTQPVASPTPGRLVHWREE